MQHLPPTLYLLRTFRGLPPLAPFARVAAAFASDFPRPARGHPFRGTKHAAHQALDGVVFVDARPVQVSLTCGGCLHKLTSSFA